MLYILVCLVPLVSGSRLSPGAGSPCCLRLSLCLSCLPCLRRWPHVPTKPRPPETAGQAAPAAAAGAATGARSGL